MNSKIMRKLCGYISIGSKMKEMKSYDFSKIKYPNFSEELKQKLISLYYYMDKPKYNFDLNDYLEKEKKRNKELGIFQLNTEIVELKKRLESVIEKIVYEKKIDINF